MLENKPLLNPYAPDAVIAFDQNRSISQSDFLQLVHQVKSELPNAIHYINYASNRFDFLVLFCAVTLKGGTNILPPNRNLETLDELKDDFPSALVITDVENIESDYLTCLNAQPSPENKSHTDPSLNPTIEPEHLAAIAYTSGSTGKPKPNHKTWRMLSGTAQLLGERFLSSNKANETQLNHELIATVPPQHMYGLETSIFMTLQCQAKLYIGETFYPQDLSLACSSSSSATLITTPVHLNLLCKSKESFPNIRQVISATAMLDESLALQSEKRFNAPVNEIYGFTEAGSVATRRNLDGPDWQLLPSMHLEIQGAHSDTNHSHKVFGPQLNEPVLTLDRIIYQAENNTFTLQGRAEDIINVAGKRASLSDLNLRLNQIDGVDDGLIFMPDSESSHSWKHIQRPVAMVVSDLNKKEIQKQLSFQIDSVFIPRQIYYVTSIPRNETGKPAKRDVNELYLELKAKNQENDKLSIKIHLEHDCFKGHFPGDPLVPAALLTQWVIDKLSTAYPQLIIQQASSLKFLAPAKPGDQLNLDVDLSKLEKHKLSVTLINQANHEATAKLTFTVSSKS